MNTLQDFARQLAQIRTAADELTVKGHDNTAIVHYIWEKCNTMIQQCNQIAQQAERQTPMTEQASEA